MMATAWNRLQAYLNERSLRERLLIFSTVTVLLLLLIYTLGQQPLKKGQEEALRNIANGQTRIAALKHETSRLRKLARRDPDLAVQHQIELLEAQLHLHDQPITDIARGMIDPAEMAGIIESILERNRHLEIIRLENLPAAPLIDGTAEEGNDDEEQNKRQNAPIYKHGLALEVSGSYAQLVALLRDLESQPWRILWDEVELSSENYPVSRLSLVIYTLSFATNWLVV